MKRLVIALALVAAVGACKKSDQGSAMPAADTSKATMMSDTGKAMAADTGKMMMGDTSKMTKAPAPATTKKKP